MELQNKKSYVKTHAQVKASEKGVFGESNLRAVRKAQAPSTGAINNTMPTGAKPNIPGGWPKGSHVKHTKHQT